MPSGCKTALRIVIFAFHFSAEFFTFFEKFNRVSIKPEQAQWAAASAIKGRIRECKAKSEGQHRDFILFFCEMKINHRKSWRVMLVLNYYRSCNQLERAFFSLHALYHASSHEKGSQLTLVLGADVWPIQMGEKNDNNCNISAECMYNKRAWKLGEKSEMKVVSLNISRLALH